MKTKILNVKRNYETAAKAKLAYKRSRTVDFDKVESFEVIEIDGGFNVRYTLKSDKSDVVEAKPLPIIPSYILPAKPSAAVKPLPVKPVRPEGMGKRGAVALTIDFISEDGIIENVPYTKTKKGLFKTAKNWRIATGVATANQEKWLAEFVGTKL